MTRKPSVASVIHFNLLCEQYLKTHQTPIVFSLDRNSFQTHLRAGNGVHAAYLKRRKETASLLQRWGFSLNPLHQAILQLEKKGFEHPKLKTLFTNSHLVKEEVLSHYNVDPDKLCVVHNGVEWKAFQPAFDTWQARKEQSPASFQLLFVGNNYARKGLCHLLHALAPLKKEKFQLHVVGKEKQIDSFRALAEKLELSQHILFWGPQQEMTPFYQIADALVIPSLYDPFANVTVEALAMGVPVLSSKSNGGHEILTPTNGLIIQDLNDIPSFSLQLKEMLSTPKTTDSANRIRAAVEPLDFSHQLKKIVTATLSSY